MKLNITAAWLNSFDDCEPAGYISNADRQVLNQRAKNASTKASESVGSQESAKSRKRTAVQAAQRKVR